MHHVSKRLLVPIPNFIQKFPQKVIGGGNNSLYSKSQQKAVNPYTCPASTSSLHVLLPHAGSHIIPKLTHCPLCRIRYLPHMPPFSTCTWLRRIPIVPNCTSSLLTSRFSHELNISSLQLLIRIKLCNAQQVETTKRCRDSL